MVAAEPITSLRGIAYVVLAVALITLNDAVMKAMTVGYPVGEIMFMRGVFMFMPIGVLAWRAGGFAALGVRNVPVQVFRGLLAIGSTYFFVSALGHMQLADAVAITFAASLELAHQGKMQLRQFEPFGRIYVRCPPEEV